MKEKDGWRRQQVWYYLNPPYSSAFQYGPTSHLLQSVAISSVCLTHFFNLAPCWAHKPPYLAVWSKLLLTRERNDSPWGRVATEIAAKLPPFSPNHLPDTISPVCHLQKTLSKEAEWVSVSHWGPGHQAWCGALNSSVKSGDFLSGRHSFERSWYPKSRLVECKNAFPSSECESVCQTWPRL